MPSASPALAAAVLSGHLTAAGRLHCNWAAMGWQHLLLCNPFTLDARKKERCVSSHQAGCNPANMADQMVLIGSWIQIVPD